MTPVEQAHGVIASVVNGSSGCRASGHLNDFACAKRPSHPPLNRLAFGGAALLDHRGVGIRVRHLKIALQLIFDLVGGRWTFGQPLDLMSIKRDAGKAPFSQRPHAGEPTVSSWRA
jgi:hypothetical protein